MYYYSSPEILTLLFRSRCCARVISLTHDIIHGFTYRWKRTKTNRYSCSNYGNLAAPAPSTAVRGPGTPTTGIMSRTRKRNASAPFIWWKENSGKMTKNEGNVLEFYTFSDTIVMRWICFWTNDSIKTIKSECIIVILSRRVSSLIK